MSATQTMRAAPAGRGGADARDQQAAKGPGERPEPAILFQNYFKSSGSRTYAAQVKETSGGDHFLVLTMGKRDPKTDEVRKSWLTVFSEDFPAFFRMLHETAQYIKANPVPEAVLRRREAYLARSRAENEKAEGKSN